MLALKNKHKERDGAQEEANHGGTDPWNESKEFEGKKTKRSKTRTSEYDYLHGPLCNQLMSYLEDVIGRSKRLSVQKNKQVDVGIICKSTKKAEYIFEVKTAALPSSQIYSAIGQLFYYRHLYGKDDAGLCLVLPAECQSDETEIFVQELSIAVVYGSSGEFKTSSEGTLENIVRAVLSV